ncbi:MAG: hypothetical protein JJE29_03775 [Peptostreptococcaceae bacterium]|nr:hypothetical protein [Peptostreptococcaceae bacterium]
MNTDPSLQDLIDDFQNMKNENLVPCFSTMEPRFLDYIHNKLFTAGTNMIVIK